ncbi:hypothetical protein K8R33_04275 [archaeon]|nr:hypothetical protein [archaeon]
MEGTYKYDMQISVVDKSNPDIVCNGANEIHAKDIYFSNPVSSGDRILLRDHNSGLSGIITEPVEVLQTPSPVGASKYICGSLIMGKVRLKPGYEVNKLKKILKSYEFEGEIY